MNGTRPVPTNLDSWPGVHDLMSGYKHMLHVLWSSPPHLVSVIGVGRPGVIEHLKNATRLDEPVVLEALREMDRRRLVILDEETREVAVRRWCEFHKFSGRWAAVAQLAFEQVKSPRIKSILAKQEGVKGLFPSKSIVAPPNSNSNNNINSNAVAAPRERAVEKTAAALQKGSGKNYDERESGIVTWLQDDPAKAEKIEQQHSKVEIDAAVAAVVATGKDPVPGLISREIERRRCERDAAARRVVVEAEHQARLDAAPEQVEDDKKAYTTGMSLLTPALRARATTGTNNLEASAR